MGRYTRAVAVRNQTVSSVPFLPSSTSIFAGAQQNYLSLARAGYSGNEIVYSAIELLATSAAEPHIIGRRWRRASPQVRAEAQLLNSKGLSLAAVNALLVKNGFVTPIPDHPLVKLLNAPNPYMSRGQLWSTVVMDRCIAGNSYVLKARYTDGPLEGAVAQLWRLRPDRIRIIPDAEQYCRYEYRTPAGVVMFDYADIMHFKTRNPFNEFYGMSPIQVIMDRLGIDLNMRGFLRSFFEKGGTGPGSILTSKQKLSDAARKMIEDKFRGKFSGPAGWHELLVLDATESTYQQMGLNRGLRDALPAEIDRQTEARLTMPFGIPGSILGLLIGYESSSYANKRQDWQVLWDVTMTPLLSDLDDVLNLSIVPDFGNIDEVMFDLSDIKALQEDVDAMQERHRKNFSAGIITLPEARDNLGYDPTVRNGVVYVPRGVIPTEIGVIGELEAAQAEAAIEQAKNPPPPPTVTTVPPAEPKQLPAPEPAKALAEVFHSCGKRIAVDVEGNPELFCWRCKVPFRALDTSLVPA